MLPTHHLDVSENPLAARRRVYVLTSQVWMTSEQNPGRIPARRERYIGFWIFGRDYVRVRIGRAYRWRTVVLFLFLRLRLSGRGRVGTSDGEGQEHFEAAILEADQAFDALVRHHPRQLHPRRSLAQKRHLYAGVLPASWHSHCASLDPLSNHDPAAASRFRLYDWIYSSRRILHLLSPALYAPILLPPRC